MGLAMRVWAARGWSALVVIAIFIALAQVLRGVRLLSKVLWGLAALVAVAAAVSEWRR